MESLAIEAIGLVGFMLLLALAQAMSHLLFGDKRLFDRVQMEYIFDAGHAALIICFSIRACINIFKD